MHVSHAPNLSSLVTGAGPDGGSRMSSLLSQADAKLPKSPSTLAAAHSDVQPARRTYLDKERELRQRELAHLGYERDLREALEASRQLSESRAASTVPLVSLPQDLSELAAEYTGGASADLFRAKVNHLRRIRGDGNCFYRAFYVSWMERLLGLSRAQQEDVWRRVIPWTSSQLAQHLPRNLGDDLQALGVQLQQRISTLCLGGTGHGPFSSSTPLSSSSTSLSYSDSSLAYPGYDLAAAEARLDVAANDETPDGSIRLHASSDLCIADGSIAWLRLVTSAHMRAHRETFEPVCATEQISFADFLETQVEAMGVEADEMHVQALTAALGLRVRVEYV